MPRQPVTRIPQPTIPEVSSMPSEDTLIDRFLRMNPPRFMGVTSEQDPMDFLTWMSRKAKLLRIPSELIAELAGHQLGGTAAAWFDLLIESRGEDASPLTWDEFCSEFKKRFIPSSVQARAVENFLKCRMTGNMIVTEYEEEFTRLASLATRFNLTPDERVRRFIQGLPRDYQLGLTSYRNSEDFSAVVDAALGIETVLQNSRAFEARKKFKSSGSFSGDRVARSQPLPPQPSVRPSFSQSRQARPITFNNQPNRNQEGSQFQQGSSIASFPPCQNCGKGHPGVCRLGTRGCYNCGLEGHVFRDCPSRQPVPSAGSVQQPIRSQAPRAPNFNKGSERGKQAAGGGSSSNQNRLFAITRQDARINDAVVTGNILVNNLDALALFDPGATFSVVSKYFASKFSQTPSVLECPFWYSSPGREPATTREEYPSCKVQIGNLHTLAKLKVIEMVEFDVILGMDWLTEQMAKVDCHKKTVEF